MGDAAMKPMPERIARKTVKNYVCSNCWGELTLFPAPDRQLVVLCATCKDETKGYVTRHYADRRRDASVYDASDAMKLLRKVGALPQLPRRTKEQNLRELGF